jgi:hypothetical protein
MNTAAVYICVQVFVQTCFQEVEFQGHKLNFLRNFSFPKQQKDVLYFTVYVLKVYITF